MQKANQIKSNIEKNQDEQSGWMTVHKKDENSYETKYQNNNRKHQNNNELGYKKNNRMKYENGDSRQY